VAVAVPGDVAALQGSVAALCERMSCWESQQLALQGVASQQDLQVGRGAGAGGGREGGREGGRGGLPSGGGCLNMNTSLFVDPMRLLLARTGSPFVGPFL
jgi:hypothetical protein